MGCEGRCGVDETTIELMYLQFVTGKVNGISVHNLAELIECCGMLGNFHQQSINIQ